MSKKHAPAPELDEAPPPALRLLTARDAFLAALDEYIAARVEAAASRSEYYTQENSPLGRRRHCELARAGKLPGRKLGRDWLVRRDVVDEYVATHGRAPDDDSPEQLLKKIAG